MIASQLNYVDNRVQRLTFYPKRILVQDVIPKDYLALRDVLADINHAYYQNVYSGKVFCIECYYFGSYNLWRVLDTEAEEVAGISMQRNLGIRNVYKELLRVLVTPE
jgi:hypothetical protein